MNGSRFHDLVFLESILLVDRSDVCARAGHPEVAMQLGLLCVT